MRQAFLGLLALGLMAASGLAQARAAEGERTFFPAPAQQARVLNLTAATDLEAMAPLIRGFQKTAPDVAVDFRDMVTNDLFEKAERACAEQRTEADLLISSAVDQLVALANDGCVLAHRSRETSALPAWANWRDEVFGFSFEPAVIVYDSRHVPPEDVPESHAALADLLRLKPDRYRGKIGTYDISKSAIGYLLAFYDSQQAPMTYGRLLESFGRAGTLTRCCNKDVLDALEDGRIEIAYNVLGGYAYAFHLQHPYLRVVVPHDYTIVLSRGMVIPKQAAQPDLARRFVDYLLSAEGRAVTDRQAFYFSAAKPLPDDVTGPKALMASGIGRPIAIGSALLAARDRAQRERFIAGWVDVIGPDQSR